MVSRLLAGSGKGLRTSTSIQTLGANASRHHQRRSCLVSTFGGSSSFSSTTSNNDPPTNCDIIKGPSLLRTVVHRPRPSLLFLPGLRSLPFWTQYDGQVNRIAYSDPQVTHAVTLLQDNFETIRNEYNATASTLPNDYQTDTEHTTLHDGTWEWHSYMRKGQVANDDGAASANNNGTSPSSFASHFPQTAAVLQQLRDDKLLFEGTPFGYTFFSTLHAHSRIAAHSAPMNLRLRVHLALQVPSSSTNNSDNNAKPDCGIRVGPTTRTWETGQALVLDDAYDHQVWNETDEKRVLLLVDLWHPDVSQQERDDIVGIFQHAQRQGWWSSSESSSSSS